MINIAYIYTESRLSPLSASEEIINDSVTQYQDALDKSGYKHNLKYQANINTANNKIQLTTKNNEKQTSFGSIHCTAKT